MTDFDVSLDVQFSDATVHKVLDDYLAANNGMMGNFTVIVPASKCCISHQMTVEIFLEISRKQDMPPSYMAVRQLGIRHTFWSVCVDWLTH